MAKIETGFKQNKRTKQADKYAKATQYKEK